MNQKEKFSTEHYNVSMLGKHLQLTDAIKDYVLEKLSKIERFAPHILEVSVTLELQKITHRVSMVMTFLHFHIKAEARTEDMYSAIDLATAKLLKLIKKYKTKLQDHRHDNLASTDMHVNVLRATNEVEDINDEIDQENLKQEVELYKIHQVVDKEKMPLKTLTQDEAIMKMELSGDTFLLYKGEEDKKIKTIYRRDDGQLGIIEVEA